MNKTQRLKKRMTEMLDRCCNRYNDYNRALWYNPEVKFYECKYENEEGYRCAIGAEIPEYLMTNEIKNETVPVEGLFQDYPEVKNCRKFKNMPIGFLLKLQGLHDHTKYWNASGLSGKGRRERDKITDYINSYYGP